MEDINRIQARITDGRFSPDDLIAKGLEGVAISRQDRPIFFELGELVYGKEGINALYYFQKTITANE